MEDIKRKKGKYLDIEKGPNERNVRAKVGGEKKEKKSRKTEIGRRIRGESKVKRKCQWIHRETNKKKKKANADFTKGLRNLP